MAVNLGLRRESEEVGTASLRALLAGVVDYAGLFPPASLDMPTTLRNYAAYLESPDAWMLARLIVPAARLDEFEREARDLLPRDGDAEPWRIAALVSPAGDAGLDRDLKRIARFNAAHAEPRGGLAQIHVLELKAGRPADVEDALERIPDELFPFFEIPVEADPRGLLAELAGSDAGAKVRTGGPTCPQPEHLARFVAGCASAEVPFKATAGLHHPLRHAADGGAEEFGFLNLLTAGVLARGGAMPESGLRDVLVQREPGAFVFEEDALRVAGCELAVSRIEEARRHFAISFGSCSFEEPLQHLRDMKLL